MVAKLENWEKKFGGSNTNHRMRRIILSEYYSTIYKQQCLRQVGKFGYMDHKMACGSTSTETKKLIKN